VAAVAEAEAAETAAEAGPALVEVRAQAVLIAIIRLTLSAAGVGAAVARGTTPGGAAGLFGLGAGILLIAVYAGSRGPGVWQRLDAAEAVPQGASVESPLRSVGRAAYPSTVGLSVLIALSLVIDSALAAVLAGILAGIGGVALGFAAQLAVWERKRRARVLADPGRRGHVYEASR
jgi:hypothetical protein